MSAQHELQRRVLVGHAHELAGAFGNFLGRGFHLFLGKTDHGAHGAYVFRVHIGHEAAAQGNEFQHLVRAEHAGGGQGAEFTEAVTGRTGRRKTIGHALPEREVHNGDGGLQIAGFRHEGGVVAVPVNLAQRQTAYAFRLLPEIHDIGGRLGKTPPHARCLSPLSGEQDGGLHTVHSILLEWDYGSH